jgi:hypothetical protein
MDRSSNASAASASKNQQDYQGNTFSKAELRQQAKVLISSHTSKKINTSFKSH